MNSELFGSKTISEFNSGLNDNDAHTLDDNSTDFNPESQSNEEDEHRTYLKNPEETILDLMEGKNSKAQILVNMRNISFLHFNINTAEPVHSNFQ